MVWGNAAGISARRKGRRNSVVLEELRKRIEELRSTKKFEKRWREGEKEMEGGRANRTDEKL